MNLRQGDVVSVCGNFFSRIVKVRDSVAEDSSSQRLYLVAEYNWEEGSYYRAESLRLISRPARPLDRLRYEPDNGDRFVVHDVNGMEAVCGWADGQLLAEVVRVPLGPYRPRRIVHEDGTRVDIGLDTNVPDAKDPADDVVLYIGKTPVTRKGAQAVAPKGVDLTITPVKEEASCDVCGSAGAPEVCRHCYDIAKNGRYLGLSELRDQLVPLRDENVRLKAENSDLRREVERLRRRR